MVWDVGPLDVPWVVAPGTLALCAGAALAWSRRRLSAHRAHRGLSGAAVLLFLVGVWWTAGGVGAWRAGVERQRNGTADFVEGTLLLPDAADDSVRVGGVSLHRAPDAFFPALHATRWPALRRWSGAHVRLWFFQGDVLRLEVDARPPGQPQD